MVLNLIVKSKFTLIWSLGGLFKVPSNQSINTMAKSRWTIKKQLFKQFKSSLLNCNLICIVILIVDEQNMVLFYSYLNHHFQYWVINLHLKICYCSVFNNATPYINSKNCNNLQYVFGNTFIPFKIKKITHNFIQKN